MSTVKTNNVQVGQSVTATNNGTWYQPATPDGTIRYGIGNAGATTSDVVTLSSSGLSTPALIVSGSTAPTNGMFLPTTNTLAWSTNSAERMRLDSSGNLGLGVTPSAWATYKALQIGGAGFMGTSSDLNASANAYYNAGWKYYGTGLATLYNQSAGVHSWYNAVSGTAGNAISLTQAMTLDTNGFLSVNWVPDNNSAGVSSKTSQSGQQTFTGWNATTSGTRYYAYFGTGSTFTNTGSITTTGSNCLFNSGSDYRLKDNPQRIQGAIHTIEKLNPVTFTWKSNGEEDQGFIAHELQNVIPQVVVGEKDAIDDFGRPQYQTVDYSKLTAILTAAIQELSAELNELKQKVNA